MASQNPSQQPSDFRIDPPLLNSSNPWATTKADLKALYDCPHTGAVTIRTSLDQPSGFHQTALTHQYTFFSTSKGHSTAHVDVGTHAEGRSEVLPDETSSLNTLGYSPIPLTEYLRMLAELSNQGSLTHAPAKPFIVSVTGTASEVAGCYAKLLDLTEERREGLRIMMEINLSCPNILDKPPPAYDSGALMAYVEALAEPRDERVRIGVKTPPYTYHDQFRTLITVLEESTKLEGGCPVSFITATNTLGGCLVLNQRRDTALGSVNGTGIGGMAGDALHPLALGNVKTIRQMLDASPIQDLKRIAIIGIGGVKDRAGFDRMRAVGAAAVGVGTALGREGVGIFEKITEGGSEL
ncbi:hypothetical protein B0O99DRAFT_651318 [Bisporella sp. PMI_857]|nr:hypothetical protein B0O99DRAFT_651318 [Bisporella sp. PMI_857]